VQSRKGDRPRLEKYIDLEELNKRLAIPIRFIGPPPLEQNCLYYRNKFTEISDWAHWSMCTCL
jgi:hypothetical protein